jgi:hypothetical protein
VLVREDSSEVISEGVCRARLSLVSASPALRCKGATDSCGATESSEERTMGASGWSPSEGEGGWMGMRPGEGGEMSIGEEPADPGVSRARLNDAERVSISGTQLGGGRVATRRASQKAAGMLSRAGVASWEEDRASSMATMVCSMTDGSRRGTASAKVGSVVLGHGGGWNGDADGFELVGRDQFGPPSHYVP